MSEQLSDASEESLNLVRRRITAVTWFVTTIHALLGIIGGAYALGPDRRADQILLIVVSVPVALIVYGVTRVIMGWPVLSWRSAPWLVLMMLPTLYGVIWIL